MVAIWLFLKVRQKKNDLTIVMTFLNVEENSIFESLFWRNLSKTCNIL